MKIYINTLDPLEVCLAFKALCANTLVFQIFCAYWQCVSKWWNLCQQMNLFSGIIFIKFTGWLWAITKFKVHLDFIFLQYLKIFRSCVDISADAKLEKAWNLRIITWYTEGEPQPLLWRLTRYMAVTVWWMRATLWWGQSWLWTGAWVCADPYKIMKPGS